jgi:peptidoglycan/LPS O-acetylase OafA/YrhL
MSSPITYEEYQTRKWIPGFDGIRALCALAVLAGHMHTHRWDWLNGNRGVTIFFVLSGFLITMLALREERANGSLSMAAFYTRRSFRIFPAYYATLLLYCILIFGTSIRAGRSGDFASMLWAYVLYLQEFVILNPAMPDPFLSQAWTLGIEEKFYLVWPIVCFAILAGHKKLRVPLTITMIAVLGVIGLADQRTIGRYTHHYVFLLLGCLLAELLDNRAGFQRLRRLGETRWIVITTAVLLFAHFGWRMISQHPDPKSYDTLGYVAYKYIYGVLTFFFLASVILGRSMLNRLLSVRPLVLTGQLSYGIYLIHRLGIQASERLLPFGHDTLWQSTCHLALTSGIAIGMAWSMWIVLEKPCIELGRRLSERMIRDTRDGKTYLVTHPQPTVTSAPPVSVVNQTKPSTEYPVLSTARFL